MSTSPILIPLSRLSSDRYRQHAQLRDYFCDKDAKAHEVEGQWLLTLCWSNDPLRYVDPHLDEGLAWWGSDIHYQDMAMARKRRGRVMLSLNDTWTLESWSKWLSQQANHSGENVVVLHVDDHKDLASPRLFHQANGYLDPIDDQVVILDQPDTVTGAILSGALGMGSFLTPFLHSFPKTEVRHLCQPPKCTDTVDSIIHYEWEADTLLEPSKQRPAIKLLQDGPGSGPGRYRFTNDLKAWLQGVSANDKDILLHIDMDYFCNRYDGDSDAVEKPGALDLPLDQVMDRIDAVTAALREHDLIDRLVDITIAFSPGFFPAEFWEASCDRLLSGLGESPWHDR
ncbi:hypothetical protein [Marinobacter sp. M5B]|uniref:hypothetical protein n=1 Tax=Marinobacter sp. M5B TaxID=3141535 RepID=UPI0036D3D26E